jgi:hypothetical protein
MTSSTRASSKLLKRILIMAVGLWTVVIIGIAIFHTWQIYNPVPVWDMWHSYLDFYEKALAGDRRAWFARHNEHRLILDRLLMWADLHWFHGNTVLLLVANYVLAALIAAMFWLILHERIFGALFTTTRVLLGLFSTAALFLLCQGENLTWGMTGQFWLVLLLPLCAFYCAHKSPDDGLSANFFLVCLCGIGAAGSMANGLAILPLTLAYVILTRQRISRIVVLLLLSITVSFYYNKGGHSSGGYILLARNFLSDPLNTTLYALYILGHPFAFVFDPAGVRIAEAFGLLLILATAAKATSILAKPRFDLLQTSLVFFVLYILISVFAIACGRLVQGIAASSGRYTTLAIIAWLTLLMFYSSDLANLKPKWKTPLALAMAPLLVLTANAQLRALDNWDEPIFEAKAIILGLALGVKDLAGATQIAGPVEGIGLVPHVAEIAYQKRIGILGQYPFRDVRAQLGSRVSLPSALPECQGSIHSIEAIITDPRFVRVSGRLISPATDRKLKTLRLLDEHGVQIGSALFGQTTPDLNKNFERRALHERYRGYVLSSASGKNVVVLGEDRRGPVCRLNAVLPAALYLAEPDTPDRVTLDTGKILEGNGWTGADSMRTNLSARGLRVYGSFMNRGDADEGSISLRMMRGARILYRSGPIGGHQIMEIADHPPVTLAVAPDWVVLDFTSPHLPEGEFVVKLTDAGAGWGEWSALALRDKAAVPFSLTPVNPKSDYSTVATSNILPGSNWTGSDFFHTNLCAMGLEIIGSYGTHGDSDSGAISLSLKRGDKLLYRSGPTAGNQLLEVAGQPPLTLPVAADWVMLDFSSPNLPEGTFVVTLTDRGTGWGEWSAIAFHNDRPCQ